MGERGRRRHAEKLRTGFTTGSCAAAGAKAALLAITSQRGVDSVDVRIPRGDYLTVGIKRCSFEVGRATCSVIKDGGDDPDVTHGAEVVVDVELTAKAGAVEVDGGEGVGTVTKPGLGLELDRPAINPVPKRMIAENLAEVGGTVLEKGGVRVVVSVPRGRELAPKTDNPRLGIVGGISILGTSGIVVPFSTASYAAAIRQSLDVAVAAGDRTVVLTTGGRSEEFARRVMGEMPDHCFVQMGDFAGYTIQQCAKKGIEKAYVVGFIGKLAKMAAGVRQTHVKGSKVDMGFLAGLAERCGAGGEVAGRIRGANTARHVAEIVTKGGVDGFFEMVCDRVHGHMRDFSEKRLPIEVVLFGFDGSVLAKRGKADTSGSPGAAPHGGLL